MIIVTGVEMRRYLMFLVLAGVLLLVTGTAHASDQHHLDWLMEDVDTSPAPDTVSTAIGVSPDGSVHVAYTNSGGKVYHSVRDNAGCWTADWVNQPAGDDPEAEVMGFDLVVDADGYYYLVYHEPKDGSVRISSDRDGVSGTVAGNVTGSPFPSMAVGPDGRIHVVYLDGGLKVPMYACLEGDEGWEVETLYEEPFNASGRTSVTLDDAGRLHVVYSANYGEYIRPPFYGMHYLVLGTDDTWSEVECDIQSNVHGAFDICGADDFGVFIAYTRKLRDDDGGGSQNLRTFIAVHRDGEGWVLSLPMEKYYMTHDPTIEITSAGVVHIVGVYPWYGTFCHYRMWPNGEWTKQIPGRVWDNGSRFSLALDERANLHIALVNSTTDRIQYASSTGRPGPPRDVEVIPAVNRVVVNWKTPEDSGTSNITHYTVYFLAEGDAYPDPKNTWEDRCTYIYKAAYETSYEVWVAAWNDDGQGPGSSRHSVTTISSPSAPTDLNGTEGDEHNLLKWSPPETVGDSPVTGYRIYWQAWNGFGGCNILSDLGGSALSSITLEGPEALQYNHTGLTNGMYHIYYLTAITAEGEGASHGFLLLIPRRLPSPPVNLSATAYDGSVALDWEPPLDYGDAEILRYIVYRGSKLDNMVEIGETSWHWSDWNLWRPASTSFSDEDVEDGKVYYYYVTAVNGLGEGPPSDRVRVPAVKTPIAPSPPRNLTAESAEGVVVLSWMAPLDDGGRPVLEYRVYRATSGGVPTVVGVVTDGTNGFNNTILVPGFTYYYWVSAVNEAGEGVRSNRTSVFASKPDDPEPPVEPEPPVVPEPEPPVVPEPPIDPEPPVVPEPPTAPELPEDPGGEPEGPGDDGTPPSDGYHEGNEGRPGLTVLAFVAIAGLIVVTLGLFTWSRWEE